MDSYVPASSAKDDIRLSDQSRNESHENAAVESRKVEIAERQLALESELRRAEIELKRDEFRSKQKADASRAVWNTAPGLAVIGGLVTVLSAVFTNFIQGWANASNQRQEYLAKLDLEREHFQSELIQNAIENAPDHSDAAKNLRFLFDAGLVDNFKKIPDVIEKYKSDPDSLPSGKSYGSAPGVIGADDRVRILDSTQMPYSCICHLLIDFPEGKYSGTGFLVSPNLVITTGHNLFNPSTGEWATSVAVTPARNGDDASLGSVTTVQRDFRIARGWAERGDKNANVGAVVLAKSFRSFMGLRSFDDVEESELVGMTVAIVGYPADAPIRHAMMGHADRIEQVSETGFSYSIDTGPGVSGAPVVMNANDRFYAIGIHAYSGDGDRCVRVTDEVFDLIESWKTEASKRVTAAEAE